MLLIGSDDGVHRTEGVADATAARAQRALDSGQAMRVRTFDSVPGAFAATTTGLYHTRDGESWTDLGVPEAEVYAVGASPDGSRLYAGTRPARIYVADAADGPADPAWRELDAFRALGERDDWGIDRHENVAQVRDVLVHPEDAERVVAAVEVGGVYVSEDGGETWADRRIEGFDAPHTDDVHHVALGERDAMVAATGSGLYRATDAGRNWTRLDDGAQTYFRESLLRDGVAFAGGSPTPPSSWLDDRNHALFVSRDGEAVDAVDSPTPDEVAVGWCEYDGDPVAATNRGTLLRREDDGWRAVGSVPASESVHGRCIPLAQFEA
ncbi:sialidase family protein [Halobacterium litoreum]|uniref:WD40 repeat domain-containing protein n=1 Tax=Halobacterium litoreum TaxID=2039234 RepID=A0ABD5NI75_9EURY|nr:WD40 repeat domain-containing protein [Halobacterium litoreum]UHH12294.1 WD40 repeat domain-containing protein [Halobacterium litoreum]